MSILRGPREVALLSFPSWAAAIDFAMRRAETHGGAGYRYAVRKAPQGRWFVVFKCPSGVPR